MPERLIHHGQFIDTDQKEGAVQVVSLCEIERMFQGFAQPGPVEVPGQGVEVCEMLSASGAGNIRVHKSENADNTDCVSALVEFCACPVVNPRFSFARQSQAIFAFELGFAGAQACDEVRPCGKIFLCDEGVELGAGNGQLSIRDAERLLDVSRPRYGIQSQVPFIRDVPRRRQRGAQTGEFFSVRDIVYGFVHLGPSYMKAVIQSFLLGLRVQNRFRFVSNALKFTAPDINKMPNYSILLK